MRSNIYLRWNYHYPHVLISAFLLKILYECVASEIMNKYFRLNRLKIIAKQFIYHRKLVYIFKIAAKSFMTINLKRHWLTIQTSRGIQVFSLVDMTKIWHEFVYKIIWYKRKKKKKNNERLYQETRLPIFFQFLRIYVRHYILVATALI